jgi:hypothetical protein
MAEVLFESEELHFQIWAPAVWGSVSPFQPEVTSKSPLSMSRLAQIVPRRCHFFSNHSPRLLPQQTAAMATITLSFFFKIMDRQQFRDAIYLIGFNVTRNPRAPHHPDDNSAAYDSEG